MKAKTIFTAILLMTTNVSLASGGLSIDTAKATDFVSQDKSKPVIIVQGPIDKFSAQAIDSTVSTIDTDKLRKDYDGQS